MERQLIKVAKEMNVGTGTVVEFLTAKGFDVDNKPMAKISDVMYDALTQKFSDSKAEKAKADQIVIGGTRQMPPQTARHTPSVSPISDRKTVNIPSFVPANESQNSVEEQKNELPNFIERPKMNRVIGKIDLSPRKKEEPVATPIPTPKTVEKHVEQPKIAQIDDKKDTQIIPQQPKVEQPLSDQLRTEQRRDTPRTDQPRTEQRRDTPRTEQPRTEQRRDTPRTDQPRTEQRRDTPRSEQPRTEQRRDTPRSEQPRRDGSRNDSSRNNDRPRTDRKPDVPYVVPPVKEVTQLPEYIAPELIKAEAPQLRGLKIQGKIDVGKFLEREKEEKLINDRNRRRNNGPNDRNRNDNNRPMTVTNPDGTKTTLVEGSAESEAERKRRRKRKKVPTVGTTSAPQANGTTNNTGGQGGQRTDNRNNTGGQGQGNNTGGGQGQGGGNRPSGGQGQGGGNRTGGGQGQGNRPSGGQGGYRSGGSAPVTPQSNEISQAQIEAKIKETMARLNIGGKNKGQKIRRGKREKLREREELRQQEEAGGKLQVAEFISVADLASLMDVGATDVIKMCMGMGYFVNLNQRLDAELIEVIAGEFGHEVEFVSAEEQVSIIDEEPDAPEDLIFRSPVVTIMGHVDHGKTSLLDYVRKADVASSEAGGITQHIGAYEVKLANGRKITFLDTPGHEAFTAMRARGAKVTDVAVVIISADDNIMPQTREAISHAQAANVPLIFAINKIDKAGADPERIKNELAQMNLLVEDWGGKFQSQDISAKKGTGIPELLEKILLEAELLDLKANPNKRAMGTVIEASLDIGRGYVTKMLVQAGTLKVGDAIVAGETAGKVKAMFNERGVKVLAAGPSAPVLVLGLTSAPQAGEIFKVMEKESDAREIANKRAQIVREQSARSTKRISLDEIGRRLALGTFKELNLIIKGDVDGSVEALSDSLLKQSHETVQVNVLHKAVGAITEADIMLASASDAIIIGF